MPIFKVNHLCQEGVIFFPGIGSKNIFGCKWGFCSITFFQIIILDTEVPRYSVYTENLHHIKIYLISRSIQFTIGNDKKDKNNIIKYHLEVNIYDKFHMCCKDVNFRHLIYYRKKKKPRAKEEKFLGISNFFLSHFFLISKPTLYQGFFVWNY